MVRKLMVLSMTLVALVVSADFASAQQTGPVFHADDQQLVNVLPADTEGGPHLVAILEGNPGDFLRTNPDGTVQIVTADADVLVLLYDGNPLVDPDSSILLGGPGRHSLSVIVEFDPETAAFFPTGESTQVMLAATLAPAPGAEPVATAFYQLVEEHQNVRVSKFEIEPIE